MEIWGWEISRKSAPVSPVPLTPKVDGSSVITTGTATSAMAGYYGFSYDIDGEITNETQLVNRYREIASYPDCDTAIEHIVNDAVVVDQSKPPVSLNLDNLDYPKSVKDKIHKEFENILKVTNFNDNCHDIFKRWYIDGRSYYYVYVDPKSPKKGIQAFHYVDNSKIRPVRHITKDKKDTVDVVKDIEDFYIFNDNGLQNASQGIKLSSDSIIDVKSGLIDANSGRVISHLFKAIKPTNQLKMMEDAVVIYRITRAPERRVFYVDVGNMQTAKAEQYVQQIMAKFRNKLVYDPITGEVKDNRNYLSMMEDFWLPRREGGKATEIQTLPAGQGLDSIGDIEYFQKKLYQSLNVPRQRLSAENNFSLGRPTDTSREEVTFAKFVQRLRNNFNSFFKQLLRIQLIATGVIKASEWDTINYGIQIVYQHDNYFEELKRLEVFRENIEILGQVESYKGNYFSKDWIAKNVLKFTEDEWEKMKKEIKTETPQEDEAGEVDMNDL